MQEPALRSCKTKPGWVTGMGSAPYEVNLFFVVDVFFMQNWVFQRWVFFGVLLFFVWGPAPTCWCIAFAPFLGTVLAVARTDKSGILPCAQAALGVCDRLGESLLDMGFVGVTWRLMQYVECSLCLVLFLCLRFAA